MTPTDESVATASEAFTNSQDSSTAIGSGARLGLLARVLRWNGRDLPDELRKLPPGDYVIESVDRAPELTREQEDDLIAALREADAGQGVGIEAARQRIDAALKR